jgi:hypothetical protein
VPLISARPRWGQTTHTARSLIRLANLVRDQDDLDTARQLHERALRIHEAYLTTGYPDTAPTTRRGADERPYLT